MAGGSRTLSGGCSGSPIDHPQSASSEGYASSTSSKPRAKRVCQRPIDPDDVVESFVAATCSIETGSEETKSDVCQSVSSSIPTSNEELERRLAKAWEEGLAEGRAENSRKLDSLSLKMTWLEKQVQYVVEYLQENGTLTLPKDAPPTDDGKDSGKN